MNWLKNIIGNWLVTMGEKLRQDVKDEFQEFADALLPMVAEIIVRTTVETSTKLAEHGIDKVTEMIPGEADDMVGAWAKQIIGGLGALYGQFDKSKP